MNHWFLPIITAVLCGIGFVVLLRDIDGHRELYFKSAQNGAVLKKDSVGLILYCSAMIIVTLAISFLYCTIYKEHDIWNSIKNILLLSVLWPIAYTDYKTYRIPNSFILIGLVYRIVVLSFEIFLNPQYVWLTLLADVIAAGGLFLASVLCVLCVKDSIGFGDMKLFIVMGLLLGLDDVWGAIFLSLIISFFISAYLLITKKKNRKDAIPFGPAIVIGTYIAMFF